MTRRIKRPTPVRFRGTSSALNVDVTAELAIVGLDTEKVERHLKSLLGKDIALLSLTHLGELPDETLGKSYGYGAPIRVDYRAANGHR